MLSPSCIAFLLKEEKKEEKAAPKEEKAQPPPKEEKPQPPKEESKPSKPAPSKVQLLPQITALTSSSCDLQVVPYMQQNMDLNKIGAFEDVHNQYHTLKEPICSCVPQSSVLHRVLHLAEPRPPQTSQQASQGGPRGG